MKSDTEKLKGVIVGSDANQEWLLPWWWLHYRFYNFYPVTFVNFGDMSEKAQKWCSERGELIHLSVLNDFVAPKEKIDPEYVRLWESLHPTVWEVRKGWFKKPLALQLTPYENTIWIDLDCQIKCELTPLFDLVLHESELSLALESPSSQFFNLQRKMNKPNEPVLNSGVIVYKKTSPILSSWAKEALDKNALFYGDQQLLAHIIYNQRLKFTPLDRLYNWTVEGEVNPQAHILHWWGIYKNMIRNQLAIYKEMFYIDLTF